jgi:Flp pilus assembly protein TadG
MMPRKERNRDSGQALLETALIMPVLIILLLNVINFGYILVVGLNLAAAPRSGALYSIMGFSTPGTLALPAAGPPATNSTISNLTYQDITGALWNASAATVQVCTKAIGIAGAGTSSCVTCSGSTCPSGHTIASPPADPEPTAFYLHDIEIAYSFPPLIQGGPFSLLLPSTCTSSSCTFYRHVAMRAMD